jgi:hypothetical protein
MNIGVNLSFGFWDFVVLLHNLEPPYLCVNKKIAKQLNSDSYKAKHMSEIIGTT